MRFSEPDVLCASELARWVRDGRKLTAPPASPLGGGRAALRVLLRARVRSVELTLSPSGEQIRDYLVAHQRGLRLRVYAQSILTIPPLGTPTLSGRRFHAARTNITRARREGITCRDLPEPDRPRVLRELNEPDCLLEATVQRWWVAETPDRSAVGCAVVVVDEEWAKLDFLIAPRYPARYLLHSHVVSALQASGVRYLLNHGNALLLPAGLLYLQARLGYELVNLQLASAKLSPSSAAA